MPVGMIPTVSIVSHKWNASQTIVAVGLTVRINGMLPGLRTHPSDDVLIHRCRFQRKQYADIEIVKTEKKGFGLRAERDLQKCVLSLFFCRPPPHMGIALQRDTFIYEYVGDVVSQPSFKKRMRDYAAEGIEHFYFMMLQKDEVSVSSSPVAYAHSLQVYRRYEKRWYWAFCKSQLQPKLLRRKVDCW